MPKINREEYEILISLDEKWKWIARDKDRGLYAFTEKPVRKYDPSPYWDTETEGPYTALELIDEIHLFQFIQWEDEEPYNIQELIDEYLDDEYGYFNMKLSREFEEFIKKSEEAEVKKDKKWAQKEVDRYLSYEGVNEARNALVFAKGVIDQLDEPEVLSQELPVIPKFVANWIEEMKQDERPLYSVMSSLMNKTNHEWAVWKSANKNFSEIVAQAWLDGYRVEKEQKYYLIFPSFDELGQGFNYLAKDTFHRKLWIEDSRTDGLDWEERSSFTENEIRDVGKGDILFEHFAVKVKELEE